MLMKRQLEDAARCTLIDCEDCSVYCINTIEVTRRCAQTALAYREISERHIIEEGHYSSLEELAEVWKLLKGSEGEEARDTVRLVETKPNCLECENCGELWVFECEPRKDKYNFIKYCPNCGVKFDEYVSYGNPMGTHYR